MKKIYLCAMALSVGSLSFGQTLKKKSFSEDKQQRTVATGIQSNNPVTANFKAPGDVIYSEDFTGGFPAGWNTLDNTANNADWVIQAAGVLPDADYTTAQATIASTSGGNCMLYYSDGYQSPPPAGGYYEVDAYFETSAIPVNNFGGVSVNFQQSFRNCCANSGVVAVLIASRDANFTTSTSYDIIGGVATNIPSADPMDISVNISSVAANYAGDIYLRWHIAAGIEAYFWMVDDIQVIESPVNDLVTTKGFYGFLGVEYTRIPVSQIQPMDVSMIYNNIGTADQTGTSLGVSIELAGNGNVHTANSPAFTAMSLTTDTLTIDSPYTPSSSFLNMDYTVTLNINSDSTDLTQSNNETTFSPFQITTGVLAIDDHSQTPGNGGGNAAPDGTTEYEAGNQFDVVNQDEDLYAIDLVTGPNTPVATFIDVVIYQIDFSTTPWTYTEIWRSAGYSITATDIGVVKHFDNTLSQTAGALGVPIATLTAGESYFAAVHSYIDYEYGTSGTGPSAGTPSARHSAISYPSMGNPNANSSFGLTATPMIRLNFDMTVGVDATDEATSFSVYPNPSNGEFTINLSGEAKTVAIAVKNVVGQTIINKTVNVAGNTTETISLSDYSKGVYFLTVDGETTKLIVE
ncbi:MAG: T9SS type A sorting domain-containing protein [Vicingaceae bacterium]